MKKKILSYVFISVIIFVCFLQLVFAYRTNVYFSNDDFRVLNYFKYHSVLETIPKFSLHGDMFYYRKIVGYIVFGSLFKFFGASQNPFLVAMFFIQLANTLLLFFIVRFLTKNNVASFFVSVIFNKYYLFYFSNIHEIIGAMFCLLTIYVFVKYPKKNWLSVVFYIFALFSKELCFSVPFFLLSLCYLKKSECKKTIPHFVVLILYTLYQSYFLFIQKSLSFITSYGVTLNLDNFIAMLRYYFTPFMAILIIVLPVLFRKFKYLPILGVSLITILPVLFFGARRELYYFYIPAIYLMIFISFYLPKISIRNILIYIVVFLVFGGRSVLPKIAWQNFPNWQKVSIENVVSKTEETLLKNNNTNKIDLSEVNLERDSKLMLKENVLDLFIGKNFSNSYNFTYSEENNVILVSRKS